MVTVVVFEFSVMRCQPLRRALVFSGQINKNTVGRQNEK
ncbi:acetyltransferase [Vibrio cholerae]